jgi:hypothetical protein
MAGEVLHYTKRDKPPGYESSSGIEGAWLFSKKPAIRCLGLTSIGMPHENSVPVHSLAFIEYLSEKKLGCQRRLCEKLSFVSVRFSTDVIY